MPCSSYQEDASSRPAWIRRRWRRLGPAATLSVVLAIVWGAPANAAGPLYAVPDHPPAETESVGFTNALNDRVRHLPAPLDPPTAQSPEEVEARLEALERGVVIAHGPAGEKRAAQPSDKRSDSSGKATKVVVATAPPDDRAPLSIAFVAAGALALIGLFFVARGRHPGSPQRA
jgi:hypothetical protein